ncbi:kinase-like domain-containing protein [Endogone sp. FLAS-F59071]|nr:kinase-like domain-containing protein [Endogone sp. FLAS-F59071]|eukprot:RUS20992.1 kinase-like domain-containing protein [Endogone sp. FLAS-F59071]
MSSLSVKTKATWPSVERYIIENNINFIPSRHLTDLKYLDGSKGNGMINRKTIKYLYRSPGIDILELTFSKSTVEVFTCKWNSAKAIVKEYALTQKNEAIFLKELSSCFQKLTGSPYALTLYGVTQRSHTAPLGLVVADVENGNLANFLRRSALTWSDRISLVYRIALAVKNLHDNHITHGYLISTNILLNESFNPIIVGFKRSFLEDRQSDSLLTEPSTDEPLSRTQDVYFLGILMWEIAAQQPTHSSQRHLDPNSLRLRDIPGVPKLYETLYKACWDSDPAKRPMIDEVVLQLSLIREQVDGMKHNSRSGRIREELKQELKKERVDRADACRTHWFAHRYMPREGMVLGEEDGTKEPENGINQRIPDESNVTSIEENALAELPSQTNEYTLLAEDPEDPVRHYTWVLEAVSMGELRDIPYEELQKDSVVGRGNYGTVYHAKWDELDVAIKEYSHSEDLVHDAQVFVLLGRHANIISLLGVTK